MRRKQLRRKFLSDQQHCRSIDYSITRQASPVKERPKIPPINILSRKLYCVLFIKSLAGFLNRNRIQIILCRTNYRNCGPVFLMTLIPDLVKLIESECDKILATACIIMPFPSNGHSTRCRRNFKENHLPTIDREFVDAVKADCRFCALRHLELKSTGPVDRRITNVVSAAYDLASLVMHAENKPCTFLSAKICLVRKGGEILSDIVRRKAGASLLELDNLVLPTSDELRK